MLFQRFKQLGRTLQHAARFRHVGRVLLKYGYKDIAGRLHLPRSHGPFFRRLREEQAVVGRLSQSERLRRACEELGPTFIKLGQLAASRTQTLPREFTDELAKLQDQVAPAPFEDIRRVLAEELRRPPDEVFASIEPAPLGSASVAQVHRAVLRSGGQVVLKVQRPGVKALVEVDLDILRHLAAFAEEHLDGWKQHRPVAIVNELARNLERELDFIREAAHLERFTWQFSGEPTIHLPRVHHDLTSARLLTMEFVDGIKASELDALADAQLDRVEIARRIADLVMKQIFTHGFFHADPHPGNIHILPGNRICFLDFGLMGFLDQRTRETFADLVWGISQRNEIAVTHALLKLTEADGEPAQQGLEADVAEFMHQHFYRPAGEMQFGKLVTELFQLTTRNRLRLPPDLFVMLKALSLTEALVRRLAPELNFVAQAEPFMRQARMARYKPRRVLGGLVDFGAEVTELARELPAELRRIAAQMKAGQARIHFQHEGLEPLVSSAERVSNRLSFAIVLASLIIGSSLIVLANLPPKIGEMPVVGLAGFILAALMAFWLLLSILRHGRM
ncbi:MAG: AarF/ABC1/UbiB kinase family protein [Limisphaerales bacterium]